MEPVGGDPAGELDASWEERDLNGSFQRLVVTPVAESQADRLEESRDADAQGSEHEDSATGAASTPSALEPVDPAIRDALSSPKSRLTVLRFEADIEQLMENAQQQQLLFPLNLTGYQRLLAHRVAQYYGLETSTIDCGKDQGKIVAVKCSTTRLPAVKLASMYAYKAVDSPSGPEPQRLLVRKASDRSITPPEISSLAAADTRSVQEREQEYDRARARIFGNAGQEPMRRDSNSSGSSSVQHQHFGQGSGSGAQNYSNGRSSSSGSGRGGITNGGNMGKKAVLKNREEELRDPDYRRGINRYGQRFDPGFGESPFEHASAYNWPTYTSEFPDLSAGRQSGLPLQQQQQQQQQQQHYPQHSSPGGNHLAMSAQFQQFQQHQVGGAGARDGGMSAGMSGYHPQMSPYGPMGMPGYHMMGPAGAGLQHGMVPQHFQRMQMMPQMYTPVPFAMPGPPYGYMAQRAGPGTVAMGMHPMYGFPHQPQPPHNLHLQQPAHMLVEGPQSPHHLQTFHAAYQQSSAGQGRGQHGGRGSGRKNSNAQSNFRQSPRPAFAAQQTAPPTPAAALEASSE